MEEAASTSSSLLRPWSDLLPELLGHVIAFLPFPADRARLRAVCRGWHSAARRCVRRQFPWLVLPDGSFCTIAGDDDGGGTIFFPRGTIPGFPDDVTCVGSTGAWLALDRTDEVYRRTKFMDMTLLPGAYQDYPRRGVNHRHSYLLHNPFSGETVPLPELDAFIGHVSESFEVRKVLMRSSAPDDVIAVMTNSCSCNVILCRPGKGIKILPYFKVCDVAFLGDRLYGITPDEDLLVFHLDEDDDGRPIVVDGRRVIKHPLADGEEDPWSWMDDDGDDYDDNVNGNNGDGGDNDDDGGDNGDDGGDNGDAPNQEEGDRFKGDNLVLDDKEIGPYTEAPYHGHAVTTRRLVVSQGGELLMVRHLMQEPPFTSSFIREVNIFKVDVDMGKWIPIAHSPLGQDEALFFSRAFCKCSHVFGDMKPGFIYFDDADEVFDTRLWTAMPCRIPWQRGSFVTDWMTWVFPPEVVV